MEYPISFHGLTGLLFIGYSAGQQPKSGKAERNKTMITNESINQAIDYILQHLEEEIRLEDVAKYCHFSKYYFCRLFKAQTGESVYGFIQRVRLQQSAFRLKVEQERTITEIGADYGYSSSNYSSAFKQQYRMAPVNFRKKSYGRSMEHPFFHHEHWRVESFGECNRKITIKQIPDINVIYERSFGSYEQLSREWCRFIEQYRAYLTEKTRFIERTYDDPAVADSENCLYDLCMSVDKHCLLENTTTLQGGRCAVYHFHDHMKYIYAAYQTLFLVWLPGTAYALDSSRSLFDIYYAVDSSSMTVEMDICLPIL